MAALNFIRAGRVPYEIAWDWQRDLADRRAAGLIADTCLLLEHDSVYTAGRRTAAWERPVDGTPVIDVDRGGKITWHGPGQLVGYPIVSLEPVVDVVAHVRRVEEALIAVCADHGVAAGQVEGRSGVWVAGGRAKIAAIGVRVARGVTMHGFAINCDSDLTEFGRIVPCGIADAGVTSLSVVTGRHITVDDVVPAVERHLADVLQAEAVAVSLDDIGLAGAHA
ncbi:MAG TPA: lipoyl(octanoyl) transferase LipB [Mycobacteriales bacterium]|nr:lipoyl(octanoyl) transferase LipB [Mycobacteriales bacterium]